MLAESQDYLEWVHKIRITFSPPQAEPQITVKIIRLRWLPAAAVDRSASGATRVGTKTVTLPGQKKFHDASEDMDMPVQCCVYRCVCGLDNIRQ